MADNPNAFKHFINRETIADLGRRAAAAGPFDVAAFNDAATNGLDALELKARVKQVAYALRDALPADWSAAVAQLLGALPAPLPTGDEVTAHFGDWPLAQMIEDFGVDEPDVSLPALREVTQRFSAEFAIRPFIVHHPDKAFAALRRWVSDDSVHVRRLVSEGSRPRLPWGLRLNALVTDPSPTLPLLAALKDDPELYVRRSVANHLNDISKDHPDLAVDIARGWLDAPGGVAEHRQWLVKHALRGLVKAGHPGALALIGFGPPKLGAVTVTTAPSVAIGDKLSVRCELASLANQALLIDYAVHRRLKNGKLSRKVFKWTQRKVAAGDVVALEKQHSFKRVTTRVYYPGGHKLELLVNGVTQAVAEFILTD